MPIIKHRLMIHVDILTFLFSNKMWNQIRRLNNHRSAAGVTSGLLKLGTQKEKDGKRECITLAIFFN